MDKDEALKLALEALEMADELEEGYGVDFKKYELKVDKDIRAKYEKAITAIRQAISAPVQEPVSIAQIAEAHGRRVGNIWHFDDLALSIFASKVIGLTTTPPAAQRQWVGLTPEETLEEAHKEEQVSGFIHGASWATFKLKEKNVAQRPWVGLTDEEIENCYGGEVDDFARAIESKLKEKNT